MQMEVRGQFDSITENTTLYAHNSESILKSDVPCSNVALNLEGIPV